MRCSPTTLALLLSTSLLFASGCSKQADDAAAPAKEAASAASGSAPAAADAAAAAATDAPANRLDTNAAPNAASAATDDKTPGITSEVAPGVAFAYRYAFTLPAKAIADMQRQHSDACRKLGSKRCQVTGLSYEQPREGEVSARLDFLLAPDIAQQFGSDAVGLVEKADGRLANATVNGENAGAAIEISQHASAGLQAELTRIEARLKAPGLSTDERSELSQRADGLRSELSGEKDLRQQKEASIATTPVSFAYSSAGLFNAGSNPFGTAASTSLGSLQSTLAFVLTLAGLALPWLLLAGLIAMLIRMRTMKQNLTRLTAESSAPAVAADPAAQ